MNSRNILRRLVAEFVGANLNRGIIINLQGMADDDKAVGEGEMKETTGGTSPSGSGKKKNKGFLLRIWNGIFRLHGDDFEKRLQYISKEEAQVMTRMNRRSRSWRRISRNLIVFSVIFEVRSANG